MVKIESNIPMPPRKWDFPLEKMKVGDSFFVDPQHIVQARNAILYYRRKIDGKKQFSTRMVDGGYRVWRVQ